MSVQILSSLCIITVSILNVGLYIWVCVYWSICLYIGVFVNWSLYLYILCVSWSVCISVCVSIVYWPVCVSVTPVWVYWPVCLYIWECVCLYSIYECLCVLVYLSVGLDECVLIVCITLCVSFLFFVCLYILMCVS